MRIYLPIAFAVIAGLVSGCGEKGAANTDLLKRIDALERQAADLDTRLKSADANQRKNDTRALVLEWATEKLAPTSSVIGITSENYALIRNKHGVFTVTVKEVTPFLTGYKIMISIGNPTLFHFSGVKIAAFWSSHCYAAKSEPLDSCAAKSKDYDLQAEFAPGRYTDVEMAVEHASADDIATLSIGLEFDALSIGVNR